LNFDALLLGGIIHVDGSINGAYMAISGIASSSIGAMAMKGMTLWMENE
jgi:hypothetical protein